MTAISPTILALDFDGVICNGLIEYFQVAWRTYCKFWPCANQNQTEDLANKFYRLRPVIETGWEMPVLIKALLEGFEEDKILQEWGDISHKILRQEDFVAQEIAGMLDKQRDEWIATDKNGWLNLHKFYPGVVEKIQSIYNTQIALYIVTTKEGRFVKELLHQAGFDLPREAIFGKEEKRPKYEILRELKQEANDFTVSLWFIEDRIQTLQKVKEQPDLENVELFLADWGYNTPKDRETAEKDMRIQLISLAQFVQDFDQWQS
ncbi:MAG: HAD family hydrolase [Rivularia sp. T60_A2020_040]|nr:HAD family hydrolase [Rivularia sp. T60_A2020_040]